MVSWPMFCKPKDLGGLDVSDLKLTRLALPTKWLWLQKVENERMWSQLPIKTALEVLAFFKASTFTAVGDEHQALFWEYH